MPTLQSPKERDQSEILGLTTEIVASYVAAHTVAVGDLSELIRSVHAALDGNVDTVPEPARISERPKPAVPISRSVQDDHIFCLEDGKKLTMLKRYLRTRYDMSPQEYRRRWGLPSEYPMVAPAYAAKRSDFAKQIGLGKGVRHKR